MTSMTNAAVARALGLEVYCVEPLVWRVPGKRLSLLHDDAPIDDPLALWLLLPWLKGKGYIVTVKFLLDTEPPDQVEVWVHGPRGDCCSRSGDTLAHACCQVVLAVAGGESA